MADRTADAMGVGKKAVQVPEGTVSIGQEYRDDRTITEVILPEGLKHIGDSAFEGCVNLEKINFPEGLETIGEGAFAGCQKLKIQPFPASLRDVGERAFFGCSSIEAFRKDADNTSFSVIEGVLYRGKSALTAYPAGNRERQFTVPEDVTSIDDYAFSGCTRLESITIGAHLSSVTGKAFAGCRKLSSVEVSPRNETYNSFDDDLYSDEGSELVFMTPYPKRHLESLSGVERVGPFSLSECNRIDNLVLRDSLEEISPDAFGELCKPKKLYIERHFNLDLPFGFVDADGNDAEEPMPGFVYRRRKDGKYEPLEEIPPRDSPFDEFEEASRIRYGYGEEEDPPRYRPISITGEGFDKIAGLDEAKDLMYCNLILPAKQPEIFDRFELNTCPGVLLYGPPGTGKTMLARAVASEANAKFYSIKSSDIRDCWVGGSEKNLRALFETARRDERAVIFFDDFDSLGRQRGYAAEPWQSDLINELLVQMQGVERHKGNVMVLAATNRPWDVDSALKRSGRFTARIYVGLPDRAARERIIRNRIEGIPHAVELDLAHVATMTEGYNGADVDEVCRTAKMHRVVMIDSGSKTDRITQDDFDYALSKVFTSVSERDMKEMENYRRTGYGPGEGEEYVPKKDKLEGYS